VPSSRSPSIGSRRRQSLPAGVLRPGSSGEDGKTSETSEGLDERAGMGIGTREPEEQPATGVHDPGGDVEEARRSRLPRQVRNAGGRASTRTQRATL